MKRGFGTRIARPIIRFVCRAKTDGHAEFLTSQLTLFASLTLKQLSQHHRNNKKATHVSVTHGELLGILKL